MMRRLRFGTTLAVVGFGVACVGPVGSALAQSTVSVDHEFEYHEGETVIITGTGYTPGAALTIEVTLPDGVLDSVEAVTADSVGDISGTYLVGPMEGYHSINVKDSSGAILASMQFHAGSHFRFGQVTWRRVSGRTIDVTVTEAWRSTAVAGLFYSWGDGSGGFSHFGAPVIASGTDIAGAGFTVTRRTYTHTYPHDGPFTVAGSSCCRIFGLVNASSASERIGATIDLRSGNQGSPVSSIPVILQMNQSGVNDISLAVADPDADPFTCRMATSGESLIPSVATAGGHTLAVTTGCVLTWNTVGTAIGQRYAAQVIIQENHPGGTAGQVPLDFIIEIVGGTANQAPTCTLNGSATNTVAVGQAFAISMTGTDPDGDNLTVNHFGLPSGATLSPVAGTTSTEPFTATFSWTPGGSDAGSAHGVTVTFTDTGGLQSICSFTITVPANQPPTITCPDNVTIGFDESSDPSNTGTATATDDHDAEEDIAITFSDALSGLCPTIITRTWTATDLDGASSSCTQTITQVGFPLAGTDSFLSVAVFVVEVLGGPTIVTPLLLDFNTVVGRSGPFGGGGSPREVETEILSLNLVGGPFTVKAGQPALDLLTALGRPDLFTPSLGDVESLDLTGAGAPGTDFPADSFFDVFTVIETLLGPLFNKEPLRVASEIDCFPPTAFYPHESITGFAVPLFSVGDPDGLPVAFLTTAVHGTVPGGDPGCPPDPSPELPPPLPTPPIIEKQLLEGPEQIGISLPNSTPYVFKIAYSNPDPSVPVRVTDTVPAEFEILDLDATAGNAIFFDTSQGQGNSANRIEWDLPPGTTTAFLIVEIQTVESPGHGHRDTVFKPTSCGPLPINDGATAFEVDPETGEIVQVEVVDPDTGEVTLEPVVVLGPSNSLVVEAVEGAKPCIEEEEEEEEEEEDEE